MFSIQLANQKFMRFVKLVTIGVTAALCVIWLSASPVQADQYGGFDETGQYRYHNLPGNPWPGHPGYNSYQRQQEKMERYRQESLEAERFQERNAASGQSLGSNSLGYTPPSVTILPDGKALTCLGPTRGNPTTICY